MHHTCSPSTSTHVFIMVDEKVDDCEGVPSGKVDDGCQAGRDGQTGRQVGESGNSHSQVGRPAGRRGTEAHLSDNGSPRSLESFAALRGCHYSKHKQTSSVWGVHYDPVLGGPRANNLSPRLHDSGSESVSRRRAPLTSQSNHGQGPLVLGPV